MRAWYLGLAVVAVVGWTPATARGGQDRPSDGQVPAAPSSGEQPSPLAAPGASPVPANELPRVAGPAVQMSQLDTFLLRDSKGNLVPVIGLPFEEFEQLLQQKKGLSPALAPGFVFEALSLVGTVEGEIASLQFAATIRVRDEGWQKIPLLMPAAVLRQPPKYEGPGEFLLSFDEAAGGFTCWLKGADQRPHVISLPVATGLTKQGDQRGLSIVLPRATEASLRVTIPRVAAAASLTSGDGIVTTRAARGDRTEIAVLGAAGNLQLVWSQDREPLTVESAQFDASGEIAVRVESEHRITSDARLRVRSYGAPLEAFRVRLPAGMELLPVPQAGGYRVTAVESAEQGPATDQTALGQVVEVRLDNPTTAATEVRLLAQLQSQAAAAVLMPARFEVLSAARQRGQIDITVDGEWQLDWSEDRSVHRLDITPEAAAANIVARFEYFRQPCGLELKVRARPSRVSVEPTHMVFVDPQQLRIETLLKYRFRGARAPGLSFEMGNWQFDRLTPDALFDSPAAPQAAPAVKVQVPFRIEVAPPAEMELKLEAHRKLTPGNDRLELAFPRPVADVVAPATVVIFAADNVELTPQIRELSGLSPDPTTVRMPGRQQPPLVYRDIGSGAAAQFVAQMRVRARSTTASGRATVRIDRQQAHIEQRLNYRVAHEPQRTFVLAAPRQLLAAGNLQIWFDGEPLTVNPWSQRAGHSGDTAEFEFSTPTDQLGAFEVEVKYSLPVSLAGEEPAPLVLPLVLPAEQGDFQFGGQHIAFDLADRLQIEPDPEWNEEAAPEAASLAGAVNGYAWSQPTSESHWLIRPSLESRDAAVHVSQLWIQTWLAALSRQERVAFRLTTALETVRVRLPRSVRQATVQAAIDGRDAALSIRDPGIAVVALPLAARGRPCVLELFYALDAPPPSLGVQSGELRAAQIEDAVAPRRVYWQLGLPEDQHLLYLPDDLAVEMSWAKDRWWPARRPVMDQRQLEAWIEASGQDSFPSGTNEYLFGALGRWPTLQLAVVQRRAIVGVGSTVALALGLLLIHVPRTRNLSLLVGAAVALAGYALVAPEMALRLALGCTLGLVVCALAAAWAWLSIGRTGSARSPASTLTTRSREVGSHPPVLPRSDRSSRVTPGVSVATAALEAKP